MSYYTISHWEADEWTDEMEAIAKEKFGPMIMAVGASSVDFVQTGEKTMCVVTKYKMKLLERPPLQRLLKFEGKQPQRCPSGWSLTLKVLHS